MRAAEIGIVDDIDVARLRRQAAAVGDHLDQCLRRILHHADEHRQAPCPLRDQRAVLGRIDAIRAVIGFGNHRRERGAGESKIHLVADLLQGCLDHRKRDGVEFCHVQALPISIDDISVAESEVARSLGSITVVASSCSRIAGPSITASRGNFSRS